MGKMQLRSVEKTSERRNIAFKTNLCMVFSILVNQNTDNFLDSVCERAIMFNQTAIKRQYIVLFKKICGKIPKNTTGSNDI